MRIEREMMRGAGPVAVLKLLEAEPRYGYELIEKIALSSEGVLAMGQATLYPMLYNLEAQGYIKGQWRETDAARPRKYYSLTSKGKKRLAHDVEQWRAVAQAMQGLGVLKPGLGGATG